LSHPRYHGAEIVSRSGAFPPEERGVGDLPRTTFASTAEEAVPDARTESADERTHERLATTESARLAWREAVIETALTLTFTRGARVTETEWVRLLKPFLLCAEAGVAASAAAARITSSEAGQRAILEILEQGVFERWLTPQSGSTTIYG
jgi:hypothetical protein